jgi:hypothetical protein
MAQLAIATAAAVVGFTLGGPTGAQVGWTIGNAIGGTLFPPKGADGPRLGDLTVQASTYGVAIPRTWGTNRIAGNVIWSTPLIEQENEQGGKGGSSYSTYSYSCSFAVGLCEGEIDGVCRIWADGKLIYDIRPENTGPQQGFTALSMVVYPGSETQEVDPTIEAEQGDAPAYRGLAYVVFSGLQLERFGNRIPNLTFEVVKDGIFDLPTATTFGEEYRDGGATFESDMDSSGYLWLSTLEGHWNPVDGDFSGGTTPQVQRYNPITQQLVYAYDVPSETTFDDFGTPLTVTPIGGAGVTYGDRYYVGRGAPGAVRLSGVACDPINCGEPNPYTHGYIFSAAGPAPMIDQASSGQFQNALYWPGTPIKPDFTTERVFMVGENGLALGYAVGFDYDVQTRGSGKCSCDSSKPPGLFDGLERIYPDWTYKAIKLDTGALAMGVLGGGNVFISSGKGSSPIGTNAPLISDITLPSISSVIMPTTVWDSGRQSLWVFAGPGLNAVYNFGADAGFEFPPVDGDSIANQVRGGTVDTTTGNLRLLLGGSFLTRLVLFNPEAQVITDTIDISYLGINNAQGKMWDVPSRRLVIYTNGYKIYSIPYGQTLDPQPALLSDIVSDLSLGAGLTVDEIDVTQLTDQVLGFTLARQGSTRSAVEQLMVAFQFDAVESEGKVKFVKRGSAPVLEIAEAELAVRAADSAAPDPLPIVRADEADLPRTMVMRYINVENDYQTGSQAASRQTGRATAEVAADLAVVLTDTAAKALADGAIYSAWVARTSAVWSTGLKFAHLEPTDVVTISGNPIRISKRQLQGNVLLFEGAFDSGRILTAGAVAGSSYPTPQVIDINARTRLFLMDIPLLVDTDAAVGFYVAAAGIDADAAWPGCEVMKSIDGGESFQSLGSLTIEATYGDAANALGAFAPNMFDEFNRLTVVLSKGALASATELAVLNGANLALVGGELIQFKRADLVGPNTWRLSGLLRGRRGTPTAAHAGGERFILMNAAVRRVEAGTAELGLTRMFKGVTSGSTFESADAVFFSNSGQSLECLSPVKLGGGRDAAGNITLHWQRRTRIGGEWRDSVDTLLGETAERYEADVYTDDGFTTVVRTLLAADASTVTYSAAAQTSDFGSPQAEIYVRIYQLSAVVGRGAYLEGAV